MKSRHDEKEPLWREEFSVEAADEKYVNRRQFAKFLVLTSAAMFVGNLWILVKSLLRKEPAYPAVPIAKAGELPVGGVKLFRYPTEADACVLMRLREDAYVAFSQKCTHLSCAVVPSKEKGCLVCPCHDGSFSMEDGRVLAGPPQRSLPRVVIERRGDALVAVKVEA
ncbi:MAG TPA: Rieske 2Fe-2S domain-containing protein [Thermoanaerobaculia bacterium]|nr:Rieske 2Fe-2S domain-containing protein [Thermoanaerobaculia bacterium]